MALTRKEIIEEYRRIEDKAFKFLITFIGFWFTIIFFFLKDELFQNLGLLPILEKIFLIEYNILTSLTGFILISYLFLFLLKFIFNLLEISLENKIFNEENLKLDLLEKYNDNLNKIILKSTLLSLLLPILFIIIIFIPKINNLIIFFETPLTVFIIILLYILMPLYVIVNNRINAIKNTILITILDYNSVISGTITIFIFLNINLLYFKYWGIIYVLSFIVTLAYSIKYSIKLFNIEDLEKFSFNKETTILCLIYILIILIIIIQSYNW